MTVSKRFGIVLLAGDPGTFRVGTWRATYPYPVYAALSLLRKQLWGGR